MTGAGFKVLVIGKTGQLARELQRASWPKGWVVDFNDRAAIDLAAPEAAAAAVLAASPNLVVNAAAYTAVDKAEREALLADTVNALSPGAMASACARLNIPFVTMSTDYVFDGTKRGAYTEDDPVAPLALMATAKSMANDWCARRIAGISFCAPPGCSVHLARTSSAPCCVSAPRNQPLALSPISAASRPPPATLREP